MLRNKKKLIIYEAWRNMLQINCRIKYTDYNCLLCIYLIKNIEMQHVTCMSYMTTSNWTVPSGHCYRRLLLRQRIISLVEVFFFQIDYLKLCEFCKNSKILVNLGIIYRDISHWWRHVIHFTWRIVRVAGVVMDAYDVIKYRSCMTSSRTEK